MLRKKSLTELVDKKLEMKVLENKKMLVIKNSWSFGNYGIDVIGIGNSNGTGCHWIVNFRIEKLQFNIKIGNTLDYS